MQTGTSTIRRQLFAAAKWTLDSRFVRAARPDQQGQFEIRGLPPGEYRAIALDYVEEGIWNDPDYLSELRDVANV